MREKALVPPGLPLWQIMGPNSLVLAALLAWCVWDLAHGGDVLWNVVWIVGGLLFWLFVTLPAGVYPALRADRAWGRWAAMRRKARFLQLTSGVLGLRMVRLLVDFELVRALAGLNRLPEALATVARHRDGTMEHRAFYLGMIVSLYEIAGDFDAALRAACESAELAPNDASKRLDLAMRYALRFHDAPRARAELERLGSGELSELADAFRRYVLGIVFLEEGAWREAYENLDRACSAFVAMPSLKGISAGLVEGVRAHRAWAAAGLGRLEESARELREVLPMVEAGDRWMAAHIRAQIASLHRAPPA
jgi:hypothetical protein